MSGSHPQPPDHGAVAGNTFDGPAAAQTGPGGTQINHFHAPPPTKGRRAVVALSIAGALAVVVGTVLAVRLAGTGSDARDPNAASRVPGTSATQTTPAPALPSPSPVAATGQSDLPAPAASLPPTEGTVQFQGTVRIAEYGPELDKNPPVIDPYHWDVTMGMVDPVRISTPFGTTDLAVWTGQGMPTRKQCADLVSTQGQFRATVTVGTVVCLKTQGGRTAALTITSVTDNFNTGLTAQATVWSKQPG
ncbi:hypothetical protein ACIGXI_36170 [Kitasatospora aureofaciens]|uniref:hypothetical protein n=1 Tax=Kitasatospora aureofaciens TaxID=1894 RepID=UPI0037C7BBA0